MGVGRVPLGGGVEALGQGVQARGGSEGDVAGVDQGGLGLGLGGALAVVEAGGAGHGHVGGVDAGGGLEADDVAHVARVGEAVVAVPGHGGQQRGGDSLQGEYYSFRTSIVTFPSYQESVHGWLMQL